LNTKQTAALSIVILGFSAASAQAHFKLHEPASWIEETSVAIRRNWRPAVGRLQMAVREPGP
jgi:hypothetical protein